MAEQLAPPTQISPILAARIRGMLQPGGLRTDEPRELQIEDVAPFPASRGDFIAENLLRWYAARAASHHAATRETCHRVIADGPSKAVAQQMHRNTEAGGANLAAALLLHLIMAKAPDLAAEAADLLWAVTPEHGALNGEWEDVAYALLRRHGVAEGHVVIAADPIDLTETQAAG
ncbi:MAG: hypothetical protein PHQ28_03425 [Mycobacterium sp.]|nr:hypothetical protein [Mycobacterium sp.]